MHSQRFTMYLEENIAEKTEYYSQGANMTSRIWVKVFLSGLWFHSVYSWTKVRDFDEKGVLLENVRFL